MHRPGAGQQRHAHHAGHTQVKPRMASDMMSRGLKIRVLTPADALAALDVYRGCEDFLALGPQPKASLEMVRADMETSAREGGLFCGIYQHRRMIGVVDYIPNGFISLMMFARPFRGKGRGSVAVGVVESRMQSAAVRTAVQVNNPDGLRFWQKMGYRVVGGPELQPDGTTTVRMEKVLHRKQ